MSVYISINKRASISIYVLKFSGRRSNEILDIGFFRISFTAFMTDNRDKITEKLIRSTRSRRKKNTTKHNIVISEIFNDVTIFMSVFCCSSVHNHSSKSLQLLC